MKENQSDVMGEASNVDGVVVVKTCEENEVTKVAAEDVEEGEWSKVSQESHGAVQTR